MTKTKKGLSIFLVVLMIITAIPLAVLSETAADTDEVVYNLGNQEITVGYDAKQAEISPWNYKLFDDNGNYTIQLEDNAFFPYEVQFKYGDAVLVEWFETPDSSVQIGGHTFYVHTEQNDDTKLSQIGLWIGDEYIAARPAPKTFTNPLIMPMSLLPIAEERLTVDLTGLLPFELTKVELSTLCSASVVGDGSITGGLSAVYARRFNDDNFTVLTDENAIMDLSALVFGIKEDETLMIQLIVGSALQLDYNNIRYIVTIKLPLYKDLFNFEVRNLAGEMQNVISIDFRRSELHNHEAWIGNYFLAVESQDQTESTLEIDFSQLLAKFDLDNIEAVVVYEGFFNEPKDIINETPVTKITSDALVSVPLTAVITKNGVPPWVYRFQVDWNYNYTSVWIQDKTGPTVLVLNDLAGQIAYQGFQIEREQRLYDITETVNETIYYDENGKVTVMVISLLPGYPVDHEYFVGLIAYHGIVQSAYVGHFDSEADIPVEAINIKEQLFSNEMDVRDKGFPEVYNEGVPFTVFVKPDTEEIIVFPFFDKPDVRSLSEKILVFKLIIKVREHDQPIENIEELVRDDDRFFRLYGAVGHSSWDIDGKAANAYVLSYNADSLYANHMGAYQTVLLLDDKADLSKLQPIFRTNPSIKMYVGGEQFSGVSSQDFTNGPVLYTARAQDGRSIKNYYVTYAQAKKGCAELFVNGSFVDGRGKREVFLGEAYERYHDIFIANLGDQPLTGLRLDWLEGPHNVEVDSYWTIGGDGNDTLVPFTTVERLQPDNSTAYYGELRNVAKIRLIPTRNGPVSGTLKISSANGGERIIEFTDISDTPEIVTKKLSDAVLYVPYSFMVQTNNIHDWNTVTFKLAPGSRDLPDGLNLLPNGEIYGVPLKSGKFPITVIAELSHDDFADSVVSFELTVKENTNINVDAATDVGYEVTERIGTPTGGDDVITSIADYDFVTEGDISGFIALWLNGKDLTEGVHYTKKPGSTRITIREQTFKDHASQNPSDRNTIAAEFREGGSRDNDLKRAAQNFKMDLGGNRNNTSTGGGGGSPTSTNDPKTTEEEPIQIPQAVVDALDPIVIRIEVQADVEDGKAAAEYPSGAVLDALQEAIDKIKADGLPANYPIIIELYITGLSADIKDMSFSVPVSAVAAIAAGSNNTSLRFDAGALGAFTLHNPSLKDISAKGGDILVSSIIRGDNEAAINITIDGVLLSKIVGGIRVALPGLAKGEVIILVNTDSGEEVVKKSVVDSGDVYALIGGSGTIKVINNSKIFADVSSANWFYNSVAFVNSRGLFVGVSDTEFAPNMPMTRAMLATVLHRLEDNEHLGAGTVFSDVPAKEWYSDGVTWVSSAGIVSGYGNGAFGANDSITREQLAVMLCNYANYIDMNTIERGDTGRFADAGFTAAWANDAVRWAVGVGIMHGDGTNLNPKGEATRAEVATMIMRFISVLVK